MTLMQQSLSNEEVESLDKVSFLVGDKINILNIKDVPALQPFDERIIGFLNSLSKQLMANAIAKTYPDVVTLAFWMRKSSMMKQKQRFSNDTGDIQLGRGVVFHIAPSNVPVNYAYSLITGLVTGNVNIVRVPSKDFPQVSIINKAILETLKDYAEVAKYIYLVRYDRNQDVNALFSALADVRVIWGGDNTISEIRKSPLSPRSSDITFADRYSLAIIDSDMYLEIDNKNRFAEDFYNDTYLTDQNACTSPRVVIWTGTKINQAKEQFWEKLHELVKKKYTFQSIMGVNKLTSSYIYAALHEGVRIEAHEDNFVVRVHVPAVNDTMMEFKDNSGYFYEYDCTDLYALKDLCNNTHCQTIGYLGKKEKILPLLTAGIKGVDRVVSIGKTMDFDFIWDGYNLYERMTRVISLGID